METPSKKKISCLLPSFDSTRSEWQWEIGIDEAGRGPLFGRVYTAAVVLPKEGENTNFQYHLLKDSKNFSSKKKIKEAADYIKNNAIAWSVSYKDEHEIDKMNIRQATLHSMHNSISKIVQEKNNNISISLLLVDGNDFKPYIYFDHITNHQSQINHTCIEGGDNTYCAIAAASILAKVERDAYIEQLCLEHQELIEKYNIDKNKGYGTKAHIDGIKEHGITQWHRRSYGICKSFT